MRDTWKAAKVGLFVVLMTVASYVAYRLVEERASGGEGYDVYAYFDDAQGLVEKSRVLIAGIPVGYIKSIRLAGNRARVDLHIDEGVKLYSDAEVSKRSASILGESLLVIMPGNPQLAPIQDGMRINTAVTSGGTDEIMANVAAATESIRKVAEQIERAFGSDEGGRQMSEALRSLTEALGGINRTIQANELLINETISNVEQTTEIAGPQLVRVLENIENITRDVRQVVGRNSDDVSDGLSHVDETMASVNRASQELEQVLADIHQVTGRTARGEGTLGRLTSDDQLVDEVENVAEGLGDIVGGVGRLQTIVGLRSEYNFLSNTLKSYVSLRLQPAEDRYYLIELINDPRGRTQFEQTTVRTSPPMEGVPQTYQETRISTRDSFRFSLIFAKRFYFLTGRFGILESTGGVGLDLHLLHDDRLELSTDLFAFGEGAWPRLRVKAALEVVKRLWILGGVDDALNDSSDFYLGMMLRFNDDDLKSILPFVGGVSTGS